jgi:hypothetical protein
MAAINGSGTISVHKYSIFYLADQLPQHVIARFQIFNHAGTGMVSTTGPALVASGRLAQFWDLKIAPACLFQQCKMLSGVSLIIKPVADS